MRYLFRRRSDPDAAWPDGDGELTLVHLLSRLENLQHLSLHGFGSTVDSPPKPISSEKDLVSVMRGLSSLKLNMCSSPFWERVCGEAVSFEKLVFFCTSVLPSFRSGFPPLRHLSIYAGSSRVDGVGKFVSEFKQTLETLHIDWRMDRHHTNFLPAGNAFHRATHLHLAPHDSFNLPSIQSLLKSTPSSLRDLRWDDHGDNEAFLHFIIPLLPITATRIQSACRSLTHVISSANCLVDASAQHLPSLQYRIRLFMRGLSPQEMTEIASDALLKGVRLEVWLRTLMAPSPICSIFGKLSRGTTGRGVFSFFFSTALSLWLNGWTSTFLLLHSRPGTLSFLFAPPL